MLVFDSAAGGLGRGRGGRFTRVHRDFVASPGDSTSDHHRDFVASASGSTLRTVEGIDSKSG